VSHDRYDESLQTLCIVNYKASLRDIEGAYMAMMELISDAKAIEVL